jgi:hypothetical protein
MAKQAPPPLFDLPETDDSASDDDEPTVKAPPVEVKSQVRQRASNVRRAPWCFQMSVVDGGGSVVGGHWSLGRALRGGGAAVRRVPWE